MAVEQRAVTASVAVRRVTVGSVGGRVAAAVAVAFALASAAPTSAQYLNAYKAGLDAIDARDWELAARSMEEAIAERGEEKIKLPVRLFLRPYLPHFYLGYARFESGDCAGALAAWAESERQGVLPRLPEADRARSGRDECNRRAKQRVVADARDQARRGLARASAAATALAERSRQDPARQLWAEGEPSPSRRHQQGEEALRQAGELLADGAIDAEGIRRAEALVHGAVGAFAAAGADLDRRIAALGLELATKDRGVDARVAEANATLERTAYLAPHPRLLRKARADLEGLVAEAQRRDTASQAHLDGLAARLASSISALDRLAVPPPDALDRAAEAFLDGRYQDVIDGLDAARFGERRARAHARLLLAASRHTLYLEGGELDDELRSAAVDDTRACRDDDERLAPTERFFSPRFIAFFEESLGSASPLGGLAASAD